MGEFRRIHWLLCLSIVLGAGCGSSPKSTAPTPTALERSKDLPSAAAQAESVTSIAAEPPDAPEPSASEPVKAAMSCRQTGPFKAEIQVVVRIAATYYVRAEADHGGKFTPLKIEAKLPPGVEFDGEWIFPKPEAECIQVYRSAVLLKRSLKLNSLQTSMPVTAVLRYQACNDELCWPPDKLELSATLISKAEAIR